MSRLGYEVGVDGVPQSVANLRNIGQATRDVGAAAASTGANLASFGQGAQQVAQRVQGTASAVANLAGRLGAPDVATGASLIASVAGSTAQFAAMGSMLGPGGTVVGAIVGLAAGAIPQLVSALAEVPPAQIDATAETTRATEAFLAQANAAAHATQSIQDLVSSLSTSGLRAQSAAIADEITGLSDELANMDGAGRFFEADVLSRERHRITDRIAELQATRDELEEMIRDGTAPPTRGGGGGASGPGPTKPQDMVAEIMNGSGMGRDFFAPEAAADDEARVAARLAEQEQIAKTTELEREAADAAREHAEAQRELVEATSEAEQAFSTGYVNSIDQVIESYRELQNTAKAAGRSIGVEGRLLERSLVASGNNIAETIGGTMKGAFTDALSAWLDGSVSFVEAAERMAKGVIKALVTESIVQAIVEGARAIASIASQDYVGAASHAAAAAAWAAVGIVAGGVGAGIGAFGGGGAGAEGGSRAGADASRERERERAERPAANVTFVVNPGGFITTRDVSRGIIDAFNAAQREGFYPEPVPGR